MSERVLTLRELNRTTLLRQLLLERVRVSPMRAIERLAGLQAQLPSSPYLALWARLERFERGSLERALRQRRVVKALLIRATMHLVSARDLPWLDAAVREARTLARTRATARPPERLVEEIVEHTRAQPRTRAELMEALGFQSRTQETEELRTYAWVVALSRSGAAFRSATSSPASRRSGFAASATSTGASCSTSRAPRSRRPTLPRRRGSCPAGTSCCWRTRTARASCPRSTARS